MAGNGRRLPPGARRRAYDQQRKDAERGLIFTENVMAFGDDPEAVATAQARWLPSFAVMVHGEVLHYAPSCISGRARKSALRTDVDRDTPCARCGDPIGDHPDGAR